MAYKDPKFSLYRSKDGAILGGVCSGLSESLKLMLRLFVSYS